MKKTAIAIALISFGAISLFGLFAMAAMNGNCIAEAVNGGMCPLASPLAGAAFHLDAFKVFSNAILNSVSVLISFALVLLAFVFLPSVSGFQSNSFETGFSRLEAIPIPVRERFLSWFSLHEKRDPSSIE